MTDTRESLWSDEISVDVVPPSTLLKEQAHYLESKTKGLLKGEVVTLEGDASPTVQHTLDIVAPLLNDYRYRLLVVKHDKDMIYPVTIYNRSKNSREALVGYLVENVIPKTSLEEVSEQAIFPANTQAEFLGALKTIFNSPTTRSILESLLARIKQEESPSS